MKVCFSLALAVLVAAASAQDVNHKTIKERLMANRKEMFVDREHSTLEMVKEHHSRRMAKIEEMIEDRKLKVADHESGRRRLSDEEYEKAARQVRNFSKKLEQMKNRNEDVHHMERLEDLKSLHSMNRLDHINFNDNLGKN